MTIEKLINSRFPDRQSPWQYFVIERYQIPANPNEFHSVILLQYHHCLSDGVAMLIAQMHAICDNFSVAAVKSPMISNTNKSIFRKIRDMVSFSKQATLNLCQLLAMGSQASPFSVTDKNKEWYQVFAASSPIPLHVVKSIKNYHGVSFASVILCAVSVALGNTLKWSANQIQSIPFVWVLPVAGQNRQVLELKKNCATAGIFQLPLRNQISLELLQSIHKELNTMKSSALPRLIYHQSLIRGGLPYWISGLAKNKFASVGLTSVAGLENFDMKLDGQPIVEGFGAAGAQTGDAGEILIQTLNQICYFNLHKLHD